MRWERMMVHWTELRKEKHWERMSADWTELRKEKPRGLQKGWKTGLLWETQMDSQWATWWVKVSGTRLEMVW